MTSLVSVIVPVYNVKSYLEKCLQSIVNQTYCELEIIVIDDGSTDGGSHMCDEWAIKDSRIVVVHQSNKGLSEARNEGIRIAKGDFLAFVDSDDWLESDMIESMMSFTKNADIVVCRGKFVEPDGNISKIVGFDGYKEMTRYDATKEILKDDNIPSFAWNKIYKRQLFEGIKYPKGRLFEDTFTTYKLFFKSNKVICIPYIGYNYRNNPESITRQKRTDIQKFIKRDLDNALAFHERYLFAKQHQEFDDIVPVCAFKAYQMIRSFAHLCEHKCFNLTYSQKQEVDNVWKTLKYGDLEFFSFYEKIDLILYKTYKPLLRLYLRLIAIIHPLEFEVK